MKYLRSIILAAVMLLVAVPGVRAQSLVIATIDLPPYGFLERGIPMGLTYELANAIAIEAGYVPDNSVVPFESALRAVADGEVDMVIMFPNSTLDAHAINMGLILPIENVILGRADSRFRTFNDVRGKRVARVRGAEYDRRLSTKGGLAIIPVNNYAEGLKLLMARTVDAVAGPKPGLMYEARKQKIPPLALGTPLVLSVGQGSVFLSEKRATPELKTRIAKAIRTISLNGTVQAIREKY